MVKEVICDLKIKVRIQVTPITILYNESSALLSQNHNATSRFPLFNQIDSSLYRERLSHFPALSMSRAELNIPSQLRKTIAGCNFHMFSLANNDIVIFSTEENIRWLSTKSHWCADGTFTSVPKIYTQIFTIHGFEGDKLIPLVYCLLSSKTRAKYSQVFRSIKDKVDTLDVLLMPTLFTCDFESGLISCIKTEFPTTRIRGCYCHFCQAIYRRVQG